MAGFNAFLKNNNIITGIAIPTEGNFKTGDIIVNVGPNSATEPMWICNEGGNPGIWGPVGVGSGLPINKIGENHTNFNYILYY